MENHRVSRIAHVCAEKLNISVKRIKTKVWTRSVKNWQNGALKGAALKDLLFLRIFYLNVFWYISCYNADIL